MKNLTRLILFIVPVFLGGAVLFILAASRELPAQKPPEELTRSVRVLSVAETDFIPRLRGYGIVSPARTWNAVAQVSGRIAYIAPNFKRGATLQKGTEIIRIASEDYEIAIRQADANIQAAEAKLAELKAQEENAQLSLEIEKRSLELKKADLERKRILLERNTIAQSVVDEEQRSLLTQQARVQDLENSIRLIPSQRNAQQQQIQVNKTQLETARFNLERTSITLPFDARIAEVSVEETQYVGVGTLLGSADGIGAAEVDVQIPLSQFRSFSNVVVGDAPVKTSPVVTDEAFRQATDRFGLEATISLRLGDLKLTWDGKVVRISDTIDPKTRTIGAIVQVDEPYARAVPGQRPPLVKGMFVEAKLTTKPLERRIVIPRSALHEGTVYLVDGENRLEIRPVKTRLLQEDAAIIASGLTAGDRVVVSDLSPAIPKMLLDPVEDETLAALLKTSRNAKADPQ